MIELELIFTGVAIFISYWVAKAQIESEIRNNDVSLKHEMNMVLFERRLEPYNALYNDLLACEKRLFIEKLDARTAENLFLPLDQFMSKDYFLMGFETAKFFAEFHFKIQGLLSAPYCAMRETTRTELTDEVILKSIELRKMLKSEIL